MARNVVYTEFGSPDVLHVIETPDPEPGAGEVVVAVEAAGVNPIDAKMRSGLRASGPLHSPRRVGSDGAGVVAAVGEGVDSLSVGDRVAVRGGRGTYSTHVVVGEAGTAALPDRVSFAQGAAVGIPAGTAYQTLRSLGVGPGDTLLVHGGSGGVGQMAVQFALAWGASVVATGGEASHERLRRLGAYPVVYGPGLEQRVREAAPGGVSVILDTAGTDEAIETSIALLPDKERIATIVRGREAAGWGIRAYSGGSPTPLTAEEESWRAEAFPATIALIAEGASEVELGPEFSLDEAPAAHRLVESGSPGGKVLIVP